MAKTGYQMQEDSRNRAAAQAQDYRFQIVRFRIHSKQTGHTSYQTAVWVRNVKTGKAYWVPQQGRCSCPHSQERCKGTLARCKHEAMTAVWVKTDEARAQVAAIRAREEDRMAAARRMVEEVYEAALAA